MDNNHGDPLAPKAIKPAPAAIPAIAVIPIPFEDKVIVAQDLANSRIGRILVPDISMTPPLIGTVVAVGPGARDRRTGKVIAMETQVGDRVTFPGYAGEDVVIISGTERVQHKVLRASDLHFRMPRQGEPGFEQVQEAATTPLEPVK